MVCEKIVSLNSERNEQTKPAFFEYLKEKGVTRRQPGNSKGKEGNKYPPNQMGAKVFISVGFRKTF